MSVEDDIFSALTSLVSGRVFPDFAPATAAKPFITYQAVGGVALNYLSSEVVGKRNMRLQINVWATTRPASSALMRQAEEAPITHATLRCFVLSAAVSMYEEDLKLHGSTQDFSVYY